jgi:hypothetical protein
MARTQAQTQEVTRAHKLREKAPENARVQRQAQAGMEQASRAAAAAAEEKKTTTQES